MNYIVVTIATHTIFYFSVLLLGMVVTYSLSTDLIYEDYIMINLCLTICTVLLYLCLLNLTILKHSDLM